MNIVKETLDNGGILSKAIDRYAARQQQLRFAESTASILNSNGVLLAECPPGVGKSFGYCVPIIGKVSCTPYVTRKRMNKVTNQVEEYQDIYRTLIVTANIALQEQLIYKDLPLLQKAMPQKFEFALAKGRQNYICYRFVHSDAAKQLQLFDKESSVEAERLIEWAKTTNTGDISDLDFLPNKAVWSELSKSGDECLGIKCESYKNCFVAKARSKIEQSNIIVCNYHLFFMHLALGSKTLPKYDAIVMDEAHEAADIARSIFGWEVSYYSIRRAVNPLLQIKLKDTRTTILRDAKEFMDSLDRYKKRQSYKARLKCKNPVSSDKILKSLTEASNEFTRVSEYDLKPERRLEAKLWADRCDAIGEKITEAMNLSKESSVYFLENDRRENVLLCSKTVDVSEFLSKHLFERTGAIILTSATLTVDGKFNHLITDLGIPREKVKELIVGSPFDYENQVRFIVPSDAPDPNDSLSVARMIERCIDLAGGRTLCLFTSYRNLTAVKEQLRAHTTWNVLVQGEKPRNMLIEEFRKDVKSVLLGVASFWAGIDIPGEALSCLIIDRLPFPNPDDPILDATKDAGKKWFMEYSIPRSVTAFRQGVGRLIRSVHDRGVVVVLDSRIIKKQYGSLFTRSAFPRRIRPSNSINMIGEFLNAN